MWSDHLVRYLVNYNRSQALSTCKPKHTPSVYLQLKGVGSLDWTVLSTLISRQVHCNIPSVNGSLLCAQPNHLVPIVEDRISIMPPHLSHLQIYRELTSVVQNWNGCFRPEMGSFFAYPPLRVNELAMVSPTFSTTHLRHASIFYTNFTTSLASLG